MAGRCVDCRGRRSDSSDLRSNGGLICLCVKTNPSITVRDLKIHTKEAIMKIKASAVMGVFLGIALLSSPRSYASEPARQHAN